MELSISFASVSLTLLLIFLLTKTTSFVRNYVSAHRTGYPVFATPVLSRNILWMILAPAFLPQLKKWLPKWIFRRMDVVIHGWEFRLKTEMHDRLGKVFVVATPDECSIWAADPAVANTIFQRRKDFQQSPVTKSIMSFLGSNVLVANGDDWQRQRKIVAPNLNERISESVWTESCLQAQTMSEYLKKQPGGDTIEGLRSIAINVLGYAGYGQSQSWSLGSYTFTDDKQKEATSYFKAISLVTRNLIEAAFLPPKLMKLPFMPPSLRQLGEAMENISRYANELLDSERRAAEQSSGPGNNFLSMLVQLSDQGKSGGSSGLSLTEDEIKGNLFTFSAAGFDTTANTMGYAVTLLAAYPQWQAWIREELQSLDLDSSKWQYKETFPKCQRVLAVMFETLRLFTPVLHSTREVFEPQQITDSKGPHLLTPPMTVYVSSQSIHCDPDIWGPDASEFKPPRWIDASGNLIMPPRGTFLPWSAGPRICPGMKMAQVEFVATLATLFRSSTCEPLQADQKTDEEQRKRLEYLMMNSIPKLTLQMRDPKEVKLKWIRDG